jgi:hypothetical protein
MKRLRRLLSFLLACTLFASCHVSFVANYDKAQSQQVAAGERLTQQHYDEMIADSNKTYEAHEAQYKMLGELISGIVDNYKARPKAESLFKIAKNLEEAFTNYKNIHKKKGNLTATELLLYKQYILPHWKSLKFAENSLKGHISYHIKKAPEIVPHFSFYKPIRYLPTPKNAIDLIPI